MKEKSARVAIFDSKIVVRLRSGDHKVNGTAHLTDDVTFVSALLENTTNGVLIILTKGDAGNRQMKQRETDNLGIHGNTYIEVQCKSVI